MMRPRPGAGDRLVRALRDALAGFAGEVEIEQTECRNWTSITFAGGRHRLRVRIAGVGAGSAADGLAALAKEDAIALRGHMLVELVVVSDERDAERSTACMELEALTVDAA